MANFPLLLWPARHVMQVARDGQGNLLRLMFHGPCHSPRQFCVLQRFCLVARQLQQVVNPIAAKGSCPCTGKQMICWWSWHGPEPWEANRNTSQRHRSTSACLASKAKFSRGTKVSIMEPLLQARRVHTASSTVFDEVQRLDTLAHSKKAPSIPYALNPII